MRGINGMDLVRTTQQDSHYEICLVDWKSKLAKALLSSRRPYLRSYKFYYNQALQGLIHR